MSNLLEMEIFCDYVSVNNRNFRIIKIWNLNIVVDADVVMLPTQFQVNQFGI